MQLTKSNLVEVKKNHTMKWFNNLPEEIRKVIIEFAIKKRKDVREDFNNPISIRIDHCMVLNCSKQLLYCH